MIGQAGSVEQPGLDILRLQKWIVSQNLFAGRAGGEQLQQVDHPEAGVADARSSAALLRIDSDAVKEFHMDKIVARSGAGKHVVLSETDRSAPSCEPVAMEWFVVTDRPIQRRWGARDAASRARQIGL